MKQHKISIGDKVRFANAIYEVAEIADCSHGRFVGIYDEPPSKHIDYLKVESVELMQNNKCDFCGEEMNPTNEEERVEAGLFGVHLKCRTDYMKIISKAEIKVIFDYIPGEFALEVIGYLHYLRTIDMFSEEIKQQVDAMPEKKRLDHIIKTLDLN